MDSSASQSRSNLPPDLIAATDSAYKSLAFYARCLHKPLLWHDAGTLERFVRRERNQHRRSMAWQRVGGVVRLLRRLREKCDQVVGSLKEVLEAMGGGKQWARMPGMETVKRLSRSVAEARLLLQKLIPSLPPAYTSHRQSLAATFFMPSSLVNCAALARVWVLGQEYDKDLAECGGTLRRWCAQWAGVEGNLDLPDDPVGLLDNIVGTAGTELKLDEELKGAMLRDSQQNTEVSLSMDESPLVSASVLLNDIDTTVDTSLADLTSTPSLSDAFFGGHIAAPKKIAETQVEGAAVEAPATVKGKEKKKKKRQAGGEGRDEIDMIFKRTKN